MIAMEVMRHSDIKLTTKTYTDAGLLPVADAVVKLPSLVRKARSTQIGTQSLRRDPKLAQIIEAWPRLSPALQAAVLAIVACPEK